MLKASEAWAITKKNDKYAEQLVQIELAIRYEAERGGSATWWYCDNMTDYELKKLMERLGEFGYVTDAGDGVIYINWRNVSKE